MSSYKLFERPSCVIYDILLGRVVLAAQRPIVIKLPVNDLSVGLSSALRKNGGSDPDAIWHRRSDGSRDEAGSGAWGSVHGKGYFWGRIWGAPLSTGTYRAYVCYSEATRPSCQITLGRLVSFCGSIPLTIVGVSVFGEVSVSVCFCVYSHYTIV